MHIVHNCRQYDMHNKAFFYDYMRILNDGVDLLGSDHRITIEWNAVPRTLRKYIVLTLCRRPSL